SETEVLDGLYNYDYLNKKDKYSMFLNGNHPLTVVKSSVNNGQKLVIFKDSYSHCLVPFLAMNFEEIHLIDLRYFNSNPYEYIQQQNFNRALFVYNLSTFGTDATIIKLKTNQ
ncbi:MAG: DHHW family protein, partial [Turicibacter sp.]|nr:DHHW family protein [Turicibacter sp.]